MTDEYPYYTHKQRRCKKYKGETFDALQAKLDGWRITFFIQPDGSLRIFGRDHRPHLEFLNRYPGLNNHDFVHRVQRLRLPARSSIDCEITTTDQTRSDVVGALIDNPESLKFTVFAVPEYDGVQYYNEDLRDTQSWCEDNGLKFCHTLFIDDLPLTWRMGTPAAVEYILKWAAKNKYEGAVLKRGGQYGKWWKLKPEPTVDAIVTGIKPGEGKYLNQVGAIKLSVFNSEGDLIEIASASGMTDATRELMTEQHNAGNLVNRVVEVKYQIIGSRRRLTHPRFIRFRPDKPRKECTWEDQIQ